MDTIVEIHIPLQEPSGTPEGSYPFPWIDRIEDFIAGLGKRGRRRSLTPESHVRRGKSDVEGK
ncbi:hypothetical protein [Streptomyces sp. B21-083]|uniref:hypothetical protein n=1 Tax=Streptomyces sp. B21-083 TaxID=3039410 RepID=UPI002FF29CDA